MVLGEPTGHISRWTRDLFLGAADVPAGVLERGQDYLDTVGLRDFSEAELSAISDGFARRLEENIRDTESTAIVDSRIDASCIEALQPGMRAWVFEMGGSHFNGAEIKISENGAPLIVCTEDGQPRHREIEITDREFADAKHYLNTMLDNLDPLFSQAELPDAVGIAYSFPGKPTKAPYGVDVVSQEKLTKQFVIPGISKQPVGEALMAELVRRYDIVPTSIAVLNDTPAVLLSNAGSNIGGVVGTGANIAVVINGKLYNTTAGSFMDVPTYPLFDAMDRGTDSTGVYFAQKQMGGMYLGRLFTEMARGLSNSGVIQAQPIADIPANIMSEILAGNGQRVADLYSGPLSDEEMTVLWHVSSRLRNRSAQLFGAMLGAILRTFPSDFDTHEIVPVEGSVFWKMPCYKEIVEVTTDQFAPREKSVAFRKIKSAGMLGAAAAALSVPTGAWRAA